jgi:lipid A 3-O-deacylase
MKGYILAAALLLINCTAKLNAQNRDYRSMIRLYYDNDFINILGNGTDRAYTFGSRADFFYTRKVRPSFFLSRWLPAAGPGSVNTYHVSLMQVAYTPNDISKAEPDVNDYPYAGGLTLMHGLHSSNPFAHHSFQTELVAGVTGPYSFAENYQNGFHKTIDYQVPLGWKYQTPTDYLFNINFTAEKMLFNPSNWLEVIGGGKIMVGTMQDGLYANAMIRIGRMNPYFEGLITHYANSQKKGRKRFQAYAFAKPALEWTVYNALLDGGVFNGRNDYYKTTKEGQQPYSVNHNISPAIDGGFIVSFGRVGLSFTQKILAPQINGYDAQVTGNISVHVGL